MSEVFRLYLDPDEISDTGYPWRWVTGYRIPYATEEERGPRIPDLVRERDGNRCLRCGHPYQAGMGQWSPCGEHCTHGEPTRWHGVDYPEGGLPHGESPDPEKQAQWRILTVHHLNGVKADCRWWNLVSLCQRCHLTIQAKVWLDRPYHRQHSAWFQPFVAAYYAWAILGEEIPEPFAPDDPRIAQLLAMELREESLF